MAFENILFKMSGSQSMKIYSEAVHILNGVFKKYVCVRLIYFPRCSIAHCVCVDIFWGENEEGRGKRVDIKDFQKITKCGGPSFPVYLNCA